MVSTIHYTILYSLISLSPSQAIPGVGAHLHTRGHHGGTKGWGAPDLSDDQGWAPAPTYPWAPPFVLNISAFAINRQSVRGTLWLRSDVSLIPCFLSHNSWISNAEKSFGENVLRSSTIFSFVKKYSSVAKPGTGDTFIFKR